MGGDDVAVPREARLGHALERLEVHVDDPEPLREPEGPLKVVEQRPEEVAADWNALVDRVPEGRQMSVDVRDPLWIGDASVVPSIRVRGAVLGDVDVGEL